MQTVALHVSAHQGTDTRRNEAQLVELARAVGRRGMTLVCGGDNTQLIGRLCTVARLAGGESRAVVTERALREQGAPPGVPRELLTVTRTRAERRHRLEKCDGIAFAPGGYDTVAELFHWLCGSQLGLHDKPIVLFDRERRWDGLLRWSAHAVEEEFVSPFEERLLACVESPDDALRALSEWTSPAVRRYSRPAHPTAPTLDAEAEGARRSEESHAARERVVARESGDVLRSVTVYMGARFGRGGRDGRYARLARELGTAIALRGLDMVYGGGGAGNMAETSRAAKSVGAHVTGVTTRHLRLTPEQAAVGLDRLLVVDSMAERKGIMEDLGEAKVAEPGGYGTAEEVFQVLMKGQRCWLLDPFGYYDELTGWVDRLAAEGFITGVERQLLGRRDSVEGVLDAAARAYTTDRLMQRLVRAVAARRDRLAAAEPERDAVALPRRARREAGLQE